MTNKIISREIADGGLTQILEGQLSDGRIIKSTVSWGTIEQAEAHYAVSEKAFLAKLDDFGKDVEDGEHNSIRILGNIGTRQIVLYTSTGGEPWKLPKFRFDTKSPSHTLEIGAGWLNGCFFVGIGRPGTRRVEHA